MKSPTGSSNTGFTLIELMIAMVVSLIVIGAIYAVYESQTRTQIAQEVVTELQEGLRAALIVMEQEIRTAGADPLGTSGAGITLANSDEFRFTRDITGGDINGRVSYSGSIDEDVEDIRYAINPDDHLGRSEAGGNLVSILDNVDALNFVYLDRDGNSLNPGQSNVAGGSLEDIRQVEITVVARSGQSDRGLLTRHLDNTDYTNQRGEVILASPNDHVRRLKMTTTITCRNLLH